jgi:histone-arginine methyltransferase CARM1
VIDFEKDEPESLHSIDLPFEFAVSRTAICHGLAVWFDVSFDGSTVKHILSTSPSSPGTHWYQCRLLLKDPIAVNAKQRVVGNLHMAANTRYSYNLTLTMKLGGSEAATTDGSAIESTVHVNLQDQMYHYLSTPAAAT